jgi:hypothetical protein
MKLPPWAEFLQPPFMVAGCLFWAWLIVYRLDWLNRGWKRFGFQISLAWARMIALGFVASAAYWTIQLVRVVTTRIM